MSSIPVIHRHTVVQRPRFLTAWEKYRNRPGIHYVMELIAEATGVFIYAYPGIGATAMFIIGSIFKQQGLGSILQIGWAYAMGIVLALGICGATSSGGGHFHPAVTVSFTLFRGFPAIKAPGYILAQIFGAYFAAIIVYYQWKPMILEAEAALIAANQYNLLQFTPNGPAGIFAFYLPPGQGYGNVFLSEFINSSFVTLTVWACLDPTNPAIPPAAGPFVVGIAYAVIIWGFAGAGIALNTARDLGGRLMAITIWGTEAAGGQYAAIAALTNFVAGLFAIFFYELFFVDSDRVIPAAQMEYARVMMNHKRLGEVHTNGDNSPDEKADIEVYEHQAV